jgi:hypothetical protein
MTTTMTADQRQRIVLLEQRQQLRHIADEHYRRAQAELARFSEDLIRCQVLFADRMELEAIPSFRDTLATMAGEWRTTAAQARRAGEQPGVPASLDFCAEQIESLLAATEYGEPR